MDEAVEEAQKKLSTGPGNLINQVVKVKMLGVRRNKAFPALLEASAEISDQNRAPAFSCEPA